MGNIIFLVCLFVYFPIFGLPSYLEVKTSFKPSDYLLYDRTGLPLTSIRIRFDYRSAEWTTLQEISPYLLNAVIQSEDRKFYLHNGVDSLAYVGSVWRRLFGLPLRGGSTITMQLVGILEADLSSNGHGRSITQKLKQIQRAAELEEFWTKEEILTAYLNLVFYRGEIKGIRSASYALFKKSPKDLTPNESYILAVLIRSPEASIQKVADRGCVLKKQLEVQSSIDCDEFKNFANDTLRSSLNYLAKPVYAPQFGNFYLKNNGMENSKTSLSLDLQIRISEILKENIIPLRSQMVDDGAVIVFHNKTGQVLAYVANAGSYSDAAYLDLIQTKRQAGSTLKPFVYAEGFEEKKITPTTILNDAPIDIPVFRGIYRPLNYDKSYQGKVTVTQSLGSSLNIPAVRALSYLDMGKFINTLSRLGFSELAYPEFYGPSLALGTADVSLWDLTNAYRTLANGGISAQPTLKFHELSMPPVNEGRRVFRESVSFLITKILSDREARSLSFGWESNLSTKFYTSVKTGTSQDMRDNWCIGYSSEYTVGVWVGNVKGNPMRDVSGISGAGPIWREVMEYLHKNEISVSPKSPDSIVYSAAKLAYYEKGMDEIVDSPPSASLNKILPKILTPTHETIFADDPDIPRGRQKILFRLNLYDSKWKWFLNQKLLGSASEPFFWNVEKGSFILELSDEDGKLLDQIRFEVR